MRILLLLLSVFWVAMGAAIVLYTDRTRNAMRGCIPQTNIRVLGLAPLFVGLIFLVGAVKVEEVFGIALFLGVLAIAKGIFFIAAPVPRLRSVLEWWFDRAGETTLRLWGLIAFTLGVLLLSWLL